ncbi:MAG: CoA-binding protein, partial [Planctomycetota bacterium]
MIANERALIDRFLAGPPFAVVGASADPSKFGHKVLAHYLRHDLTAFPVHPRESEILGQKVYRDLRSLPEPVRHVSVITPPSVTELVVDDAAEVG